MMRWLKLKKYATDGFIRVNPEDIVAIDDQPGYTRLMLRDQAPSAIPINVVGTAEEVEAAIDKWYDEREKLLAEAVKLERRSAASREAADIFGSPENLER